MATIIVKSTSKKIRNSGGKKRKTRSDKGKKRGKRK